MWYTTFFIDYCNFTYLHEEKPSPPPDLAASLEYILFSLTDRENAIVHERYQDGMTYVAIAEVHSISRSRVMQIIHKVFHIIRWTPLYQGVFIYGLQEYVTREKNKAAEQVRTELTSKLHSAERELAQAKKREEKLRRDAELKSIPIIDLDITPHAQRVLKENGFHIVGDILTVSAEKLLSLPQMGRTTLQSITDALEGLGLNADKQKPVKKRVVTSRKEKQP